MEFFLNFDYALLEFINRGLSNSFFDAVMPLLRNKFIWLPFYIWVVAYLFDRQGLKRGLIALLIIISSIVLTDFTSGVLLKKSIQRIRPCQIEQAFIDVEERVRCSYSYSFPSAHAANHFGMALTFFLVLGIRKRWFKYGLIIWAGLISFAQVYVGIHFPLDVIGGALLGVILVRLYFRIIGGLIQDLNFGSTST